MRSTPSGHDVKERSSAGAPLSRKSARELARLIRTRAVSPVEVLDAYLAVIEALNPKLNAIITLAAEQARDAAKRAEAAVGGLAAAAIGDPAVFVSVDAMHQGPQGGGPCIAIIDAGE